MRNLSKETNKEIYKTNQANIITISNQSVIENSLIGLYEFSKLKLAPTYQFQRKHDNWILKIKTYPTLLQFLQKESNSSKDVENKFKLIESKIDLFLSKGFNHLNLSLENIFLPSDNEVLFNHLEEFVKVRVSKSNEYITFANNIHIKNEWNLIRKENWKHLESFLLRNMSSKNTIETLHNESQKYFNREKTEDQRKLKSATRIKSNERFLNQEMTKTYQSFIYSNFGKQSFTLLLPNIEIKQIYLLVNRDTVLDKSWIFSINNKFIIKLTRTNNDKKTDFFVAKYEIMMHQKFIEAGDKLNIQMAPKLYHYNQWQHQGEHVIGWCSEKIQLVSKLFKKKQSKETIQSFFIGVKIFLENLCLNGLWHYDSHLYNWGYVIDEKNKNKKIFMLFDYEYASTGYYLDKTTNEYKKDKLNKYIFQNHPNENCNWYHEVCLLAWGLRNSQMSKSNFSFSVEYFCEMYKNIYDMIIEKYKTTNLFPPIDFDKSQPAITLDKFPEDSYTDRFSHSEKIIYVTQNIKSEWHPF